MHTSYIYGIIFSVIKKNNIKSIYFNNLKLKELYKKENIKSSVIDMREQAIYNNKDKTKEIDVGSCDRWKLLYNMLKGSFIISD